MVRPGGATATLRPPARLPPRARIAASLTTPECRVLRGATDFMTSGGKTMIGPILILGEIGGA